jgi:RNA polymerase sigma-70 factor, ECF subfamily
MPQNSTNRTGNSQDDPHDLRFREVSDENIVLEVQRGNGDAFAVLFDRYHRLVLMTALKIVRDVAEAEEITQDVFFEIYQTAGKFDPARGTLKVWLLQYAYHRSINRRNYLLLRQFYDQADLADAAAWEESARPTAAQLPVQELRQLVGEILGCLKETERRVIQMVVFEGLTLKEAAERTQESFSSVRNHYYRGLDRLRACLSPRPVVLRSERPATSGEVSRVKA